MDTAEQQKKQYDWLKPYQFKPGQSGNPKGRKPGSKSLKTWLKEHFEDLDDEGKQEFLSNIPPELAWRMAEGNPQTNTDITSDGKPLPQQIAVVYKEFGDEDSTE